MKLKIYNQFDELKLTVSPSDNSTRQRGVMADHVLGLSFVSFDFVRLEVNDWVEFEGQRYWLVEEYVPKQTSTVEWEYDVKFYGPENLLSQALMLKTVDGENDPVFSLTAPAHEQVALVVENINRQMGTTDWKVGEVIDTENLVVDYEGTYCNEALNKIADAAETEWWIDGMTVNLGRCEYGESVPLGYANGAESIDIASANGVKFFTRLFPIGSSRNIDREHYGAARLQLPGGAKYVEQDTHLGIVEHYEREAFSGIYPRRVGKVSSVRSENATGEDGDPFTIYYFKDEELSFDPNTYEIGGLVKQVTFQSGELNGREFEVNFDSKSREFEIITQWPYEDETQLPGGLLVPKPGDEYILWNLRMPDEYYTLAEQEFAEAVEAYMLKHRKDRRVYKVTTDYVDIGARGLRFDIGQRIRLESTRYFPESGYRDSRIVRFTQNLNIPTQYDLEISDVLSTGTLSRIEDNIEEVRNYTRIATSNLPDVVRSWENTPPSDFNLFSAKRSCKEFLSKRQGGTVEGQVRFMQRITLDKGFRTHDFASGPTGFGGQIDEQGVSELESLVLRRSLTVPELNYNRVEISVGDDWSAPGGGIIKEIDTSQQLVTLKLEDGERGAVAVGDICMGIFHSTTLSDNAAEDADDSRGNRTFAGFATAYFRITEVLGDHNEQFKYELRPVSTSYPAQITPMISMKFVAYGSFTDASRRTSRYSTRTYQRYLRGVSGWEFTTENIAAQFGDLSNLSVFGLAMSGYSAYLDNIYMQGLLRSLDGTFIIDTKTRSLLMASGETGVGLAFNPEQGLKIGAVYDPETGKFQKEYDIEQIAKTANDTKEELDNLQYSADNIVNGSHADWVAARTDAYGYESGNNLGIDYMLIRGNLITYRVELKGESAQASELGFEIKITYSDGTTQWLTRYTTPYIPDRGTFEKTYTFSSQVQDKEIASAVLYPVFKSSSGGEVSGKLYIRHEFVGVGNKLPAMWSPSVADQEKYTDEKVENIQFSAGNMVNGSHADYVDALNGMPILEINTEYLKGQELSIRAMLKGNNVQAEQIGVEVSITYADNTREWFNNFGVVPNGSFEFVHQFTRKVQNKEISEALLYPIFRDGEVSGRLYIKHEFVGVGNKLPSTWSPSVADQQAEIDAARKAADDAAAGVDSLKNFTDKAFADGIIDRAEAASIEKYINSVSETKNAVAASYTVVYENSLLGGTAKSNLHAAKSAFDTAVASLLASISTASADGVATAEEKAGVDAKYAIFNEAYSTYTVRIEEAEKYIQIAINTKAQGAYQIAEELQGKISNINRILEDHQSQIDGQIVSWTGTEVPTLRNYPASQWTTPEEVARHENDLYDREISADNGQKVYESYKFRNIDGTYQWVRIADSDSAAVRIIAEDALGIANRKSANFYGSTVPVPPYHIDDVWYKSIPGKQELQGVYICNTDREKGDTALLSDWGLVDDSAARLRQMSSDSVISKEEKASLRNTLVQREKEMVAYRKDATTYGVSISALNTAYQSLVNFLTGTVAVNNNTDTELTSEQRASYNGYFAAYDAEVSRFMNLVADAVAQQKVNDIQLGTNILNGSHADWVAAFAGGSGYATGDSVLYLDHTLIRGKQITYRVELKGEGAQAPNLGFEIKVHFTDGTDQWLARYSAGDIPERGTFEKAYTFSSQVQDKEIEYARLYPVFRSLSGGEVSGKLYIRHEFVGVGNKLPSTWSPSVADQETKIPDVEYIKKLFPASMDVDGAAIAQTLAVKNDAGSQVLGFINGSSNFSDPTHGICMMAMGMSSITGWKTAKTRLYGDGHFVSASAEITGKITAQTGVIGPFTITTSYLTGTEGSSSLRLSSNLIRFTDTYSSAYIGNNVFPASMGDTVRGPARFEVNRSVSSGSANVGVYVSSSGATDYDDMIDSGNHALYIPSGDICGLRFRVRRLSSSQTLSEMDTFILVTTSGTIDLTLPSSPQPGQLYFFKLIGSGKFNIKVGASGHYISNNRSDRITTWGFNSAPIIMLVWDRVNKIWHGGHLAAG